MQAWDLQISLSNAHADHTLPTTKYPKILGVTFDNLYSYLAPTPKSYLPAQNRATMYLRPLLETTGGKKNRPSSPPMKPFAIPTQTTQLQSGLPNFLPHNGPGYSAPKRSIPHGHWLPLHHIHLRPSCPSNSTLSLQKRYDRNHAASS